MNIRVLDYEEHALQNGSNAQAAAYIHMMDAESGRVTYGVGVSSNITRASVRAMFSAVNRLELERAYKRRIQQKKSCEKAENRTVLSFWQNGSFIRRKVWHIRLPIL